MGRAPSGPACVAHGLPEEKGLEPNLRGLASVDGLFPCPAQVPHRCILHLGPGDRGEVSRAPQAGQCEGIPAVGLNPIAWFLGDQRGRDAPADLAFLRQGAVEPRATRAGFIEQDKVGAFGLPPTDALLDVTRSGPEVAERDDRGAVVLRDRGDGNRRFMDIQTDVECARLLPG